MSGDLPVVRMLYQLEGEDEQDLAANLSTFPELFGSACTTLVYTSCNTPMMCGHTYVPYADKFSRDFIFANFANQQAFAKIVCIWYKFAAAGHHL